MASKTTNPKLPLFNPNWAQLQQKLKTSRLSKPSEASNPDIGRKTLETTLLGKRKERPDSEPDLGASVLMPTNSDCSLTDAIAMDCEMVGVSSQGNKSALGRVTLLPCNVCQWFFSQENGMFSYCLFPFFQENMSCYGQGPPLPAAAPTFLLACHICTIKMVNAWGNVLYDEYVCPLERVVDFRSEISGIRPHNLRKAKEFRVVQKKVAELIEGRILVGHGLYNDLKALLLSHPKKDMRDTSEYQSFQREGRKQALRVLASQILGVKIQQKEHCPIEDSRAAMLMYQRHKKEWEKSLKVRSRLKERRKNQKRKKSKQKGAT